MIASFNVTSQCGLAPSECPVVGSGRASASRMEDKLEYREMLFCVTDGRFGFVYSYHATTFAFRHPRFRPRPAPPVSQSPQRLEPDCGDPTETQASDRRHITPKPSSPLPPYTLTGPWRGAPRPWSPCPGRAGACPSCTASASHSTSSCATKAAHLVPTRMSVWIRGAPDW